MEVGCCLVELLAWLSLLLISRGPREPPGMLGDMTRAAALMDASGT